MRFFIASVRVSQAVRKTNRGTRPRILSRYGTVRSGSNFAVSIKVQSKKAAGKVALNFEIGTHHAARAVTGLYPHSFAFFSA